MCTMAKSLVAPSPMRSSCLTPPPIEFSKCEDPRTHSRRPLMSASLIGRFGSSAFRLSLSSFLPNRGAATASVLVSKRCLVLTFGGGNETARVHQFTGQGRGGVALRCKGAAVRSCAPDRLPYRHRGRCELEGNV